MIKEMMNMTGNNKLERIIANALPIEVGDKVLFVENCEDEDGCLMEITGIRIVTTHGENSDNDKTTKVKSIKICKSADES